MGKGVSEYLPSFSPTDFNYDLSNGGIDMKRFLKLFALSIWMLPQNILGFICFMGFLILDFFSGGDFNVIRYKNTGRVILLSSHQYAGVTLGFFSVLSYRDSIRYPRAFYKTLGHETGHFIQNEILGPLYTIVIAIPSVTWNIFQYLYHKVTGKTLDYYKFYPEKWADKLGRVIR